MLPGDYDFTIQKKFQFDKLAFEAWILHGGTLEKASRLLTKKGIINRKTGKPYTYMGIYQAAQRYIVYNHHKVRPILEDVWKDYGVDVKSITQADWEKYVLKIAISILGKSSVKRFKEWLNSNPEFMKYEYMYAEKLGINVERQVSKYE